MNANDRFEYMADLFFKETGLWAPGKDSCAAFGCRSDEEMEETQKQWRVWTEDFYSKMFDNMVDANELQDELDLADEIHHDELVDMQTNVNNTSKRLS